MHLDRQPLKRPELQGLVGYNDRDCRIGSRSGMFPGAGVAKLCPNEAGEMRGKPFGCEAALAGDRIRATQNPAASIDDRSQRIHHSDYQHLDGPHLAKRRTLTRVLSIVEV